MRSGVHGNPSANGLLGSTLRYALYGGLASATLLVHGYHPFAEDGGLYAAGVEHLLDPELFPHDTAFVTEHLRFSVFAPVLAAVVRHTAISLEIVLLLAYLSCAALTFAAADRLLLGLNAEPSSRLGGLLLLWAWWTMPIAGTSLFLQDPYLTARTVALLFSLWALALAFPERRSSEVKPLSRRFAPSALFWIAAFAFHPLMTGYAFALFVCLLAVRSKAPLRHSLACAAAAMFVAGGLQWRAAPESPAVIAASLSRYYWFLSRWQWFELLGLVGPLLVLCALLGWGGPHLSDRSRDLARACLLLGGIALLVAAAYAHASSSTHAVARLQPLRAFLMIYIVMILLLGAAAASWWHAGQLKTLGESSSFKVCFPSVWIGQTIPLAGVALLAGIMYGVQRAQFPASQHLEVPGRFEHSPNSWVQAFLWARTHTPKDALFALDAHYISEPGEDAQTFRSIARRSVLPDYSKDGGEASITPSLAETWFKGQAAQAGLATLSDAQRAARLQPFAVGWMILLVATPTAHHCPYSNQAVKVCRL